MLPAEAGSLIRLRPALAARDDEGKQDDKMRATIKMVQQDREMNFILGTRNSELGETGDAGEVLNEDKDEVGADNTNQADNGRGEGGGGGGGFFLVATRKKILKAAGDKHGKKSQAGDDDNNLKYVVKKTFETFNIGNVGVGGINTF